MKLHSSQNTLHLLHTLIDILPDLIYIKDTQSRFLLANQALARVFGLKDPKEVIGKTDFDFHPPELAKRYYADEQALLQSGQPLINHEEPVLNHTTGEMRWLLTTKIPFRDKHGQIAGFIGLNRDITERKQSDEALQQITQARTAELEALQHIMQQINVVAERLGHSSATMTETSAQMASGATQTSQQVAMISNNSQRINQNITTFSVALEEFTASIHELSQAVHDVTGMITNAVTLTDTSYTAITKLDGQLQEIGKISKMITVISQQTKFLALNANIEAARVGEAGQGFKMVADEVKTLARDTATAAEGITKKIATIQANSHDTAVATTELVNIIREVSDFSQNVATAMTQQAQTTDNITTTIVQTTRDSDEITHAIAEVATAAKHAAHQAAIVQQEAVELAGLAKQLRQLVTQFNPTTPA